MTPSKGSRSSRSDFRKRRRGRSVRIRSVQRSFWFHGTVEDARDRRTELAAQFAEYRSVRRAAPFLTVGELLERWLAAQHDWRPSTWSSARSNAKALTGDPIANRRVSTLKDPAPTFAHRSLAPVAAPDAPPQTPPWQK
jgi:hypothetical protein